MVDRCRWCKKFVAAEEEFCDGCEGAWKPIEPLDHWESPYGPTWHERRREALEAADWTCEECGIHYIECNREHGPLHVHHVVPYKEFDSDEEAHRLENLTVLCPPCHWEAERKS